MQTRYFDNRPQGITADGLPIVGSKTFYLTGTTTKITVYSDKERLTPRTNPVNADDNGRFPAIFFDPADLTAGIKVIFHDGPDGTGSEVYSDDPYGYDTPLTWADLSSVLTRAQLGEAFYPRTGAESDAGITPTNYQYEPGNVIRYGADPSGATDSHTAIQAAINCASFAHAGGDGDHPAAAYIPTGYFFVASDLYDFYDETNNSGFNSADDHEGRIHIYGDLMGNQQALSSNPVEPRGSVLNFSAGKRWIMADAEENAYNALGHDVARIGVITDVDGIAVQCHGFAHSSMQKVCIVNKSSDAAAVGLSVKDAWIARFQDIYLTGPDYYGKPVFDGGSRYTFTGTGLVHNVGNLGGGDTEFINVNANGWARGFELGEDYTGDDQYVNDNTIFRHCQAHYNSIGFDVKSRVGGVLFDQCYAEFNYKSIETGVGAGMWIHESAGKKKLNADTNRDGMITLRTFHVGCTDDNEHYHILLGSSDVDENASAHGNVTIEAPEFGQTNANTTCIRRYNSPENGFVKISDPTWSYNGGKFLQLEDEPQYRPITLKGTEGLHWKGGTNPGSAADFVNDGSGNDLSKWLGGHSDIAAALGNATGGSPDTDYTNCLDVNRHIVFTPTGTGTHTIKLPSYANSPDMDILIVKNNAQATSDITLEVEAPVWVSGTYYTRGQIVEDPSNANDLYMAIISGSSATEPHSDSSRWASVTNNQQHTINGASSWTSGNTAKHKMIQLSMRASNGKRENTWTVIEHVEP